MLEWVTQGTVCRLLFAQVGTTGLLGTLPHGPFGWVETAIYRILIHAMRFMMSSTSIVQLSTNCSNEQSDIKLWSTNSMFHKDIQGNINNKRLANRVLWRPQRNHGPNSKYKNALEYKCSIGEFCQNGKFKRYSPPGYVAWYGIGNQRWGVSITEYKTKSNPIARVQTRKQGRSI